MADDPFGDTLCDRCGDTFDLEEVRGDFDHHYAGSSNWTYDQVVSGRLCASCAEDDATSRWMSGQLDADDGPPPSGSEMADAWRIIGKLFGR